jgi:hypothetical protein
MHYFESIYTGTIWTAACIYWFLIWTLSTCAPASFCSQRPAERREAAMYSKLVTRFRVLHGGILDLFFLRRAEASWPSLATHRIGVASLCFLTPFRPLSHFSGRLLAASSLYRCCARRGTLRRISFNSLARNPLEMPVPSR